MEHATKMIMVPETAYSSLLAEQQQQIPASVKQQTVLDQQMQAILSDPHLPADEKLNAYNQTLRRYSFIKESPDSHIADNPMPVARIQTSIPKASMRKGQILLDHIIENSSAIGVDAHNQLKVNGTVVPNTNIIDLVNHAVKNSFTGKDPEGYDSFIDILKATNVPREAFPTESRRSDALSRTSSASESPAHNALSPPVAALFQRIDSPKQPARRQQNPGPSKSEVFHDATETPRKKLPQRKAAAAAVAKIKSDAKWENSKQQR